MGSGSRYNKSRSRKRKGFAGNLGNSTDNNQQQVQLPTSASAKKLKTSSETETSCGIVHGCNFIIAQKMGLAQFFGISCTESHWRINFCSSKEVTKSNNSQGRKSYEVNRRTLVFIQRKWPGI